MKRVLPIAAVAALLVAAATAKADDTDNPIDPAARAAFDQRLFGNTAGDDKLYACFVRRYDAAHLARHPKQKVTAMKLLVTAQKPEPDHGDAYSFQISLKHRAHHGGYESSGFCRHVRVAPASAELRFGCGVECDGGGIDLALKPDNNVAMVGVERLRIWPHNKPDDEASEDLDGDDDKLFRLDRTDPRDCAALISDRKERAALRRKR